MKKLAIACVAVLGALLVTVGMAPWAQAYPNVSIDLSVDRQTLYSGESFTATGTSNVDCAWTTEWDGKVHTGAGSNGSPFITDYEAPVVTKVTPIPLHGTCVYDDPSSNARASVAGATWERTIVVTVLPRGNAAPPNNGADLPNTGGPNLLFLLGGLGLLLTGATAVVVARRRAEIDIVPGQA